MFSSVLVRICVIKLIVGAVGVVFVVVEGRIVIEEERIVLGRVVLQLNGFVVDHDDCGGNGKMGVVNENNGIMR